MKKYFFLLIVLAVTILACNLTGTTPTQTAEAPQPENTLPAIPLPTVQPSPETGTAISYGPLSIIAPQSVATGFSGSQVARAEGENITPWEVTPGHTQIILEGYPLQEKFHQAQIFVYPAQDYAEIHPPAFESIHRLDNILYSPDEQTITAKQLPTIPFFNAAQVFASNIQVISFQNGSGVRFLTEYAQYAAPANNHDLFYQFQGVSRDGAYYLIAIFPVTAPLLADSSDVEAVPPPGGVAYPDISDPNIDVTEYYAAVTNLLDNTSPDAFSPSLGQLDALIQSMLITP